MEQMFIKAMVLTGQGPDRVSLYTNLPSPFKDYSDRLVLSFETFKGNGVAYVKENFGLDPEVIDRGGKLQPFKD
jgi:hypothetical protein